MKTTTLKNPPNALRGLCAAGLLTAMLLAAHSATAAFVQYRFTYSGEPENSAIATGIITADDTVLQNPGRNDGYFTLGQPLVDITMTISGASSGNGTFNTLDFTNYFLDIADPLNLNQQWVGQPQPSGGGIWGMSDQTNDFNFFGTDASSNAPVGEDFFFLVTDGGNGDGMVLTSVTPLGPADYFRQGASVPGIPGATFISFGVPTVNDGGQIACLAKWQTSPGHTASGICVAGAINARSFVPSGFQVVLKVGDTIMAPSGIVTVQSLTDPVLSEAGDVAFLATFAAPVANRPGGDRQPGSVNFNTGVVFTKYTSTSRSNYVYTPVVVAQTGTQAAGAPQGAIWQSFGSVAYPVTGGAQPFAPAVVQRAAGHRPFFFSPNECVLFTGAMTMGHGGVTGTNNAGVWISSDGINGFSRLILRSGTTVINSNTVKSFSVLNSVAGSPGQTHSFNNNGELIANVLYQDGVSAITEIPLFELEL